MPICLRNNTVKNDFFAQLIMPTDFRGSIFGKPLLIGNFSFVFESKIR